MSLSQGLTGTECSGERLVKKLFVAKERLITIAAIILRLSAYCVSGTNVSAKYLLAHLIFTIIL